MKNRIIQAFALACILAITVSNAASYETTENDHVNVDGLTAGSLQAVCCDAAELDSMIADADLTDTAAAETMSTFGYANLGISTAEGNVNIRNAAAEDATIVGKLPENGGCEILGQEGDWYQISSGKVEGYVSAQFILTGQDAIIRANEVASYVGTITADTLRVRSEPNTDSDIIALMPEGEEIEIVSITDEWMEVNVDDETGYISGDYVDAEYTIPDAMTMEEARFGAGVSEVRASLVTYALQFVGNPYVWGGTSLTHGADCSGFVMSVFANYGISLPHSSRAQANCGTRISASEAQPGDLFFYGGKSISHVAIYIGNGMIVHASNKKTGIKTSSAYYRSPVCVVRILP